MKSRLASYIVAELVFVAAAAAQQSIRWNDSSILNKGELQELREPLAQILQFTIVDGQLRVDRKAWERAARENKLNDFDPIKDAMERAQANMPMQNGIAAAKVWAMSQFMFRTFTGEPPLLFKLFDNIKHQARKRSEGGFGEGGPGSSGSDDHAEWKESFSGDTLAGNVKASKDSERLVLTETEAPHRQFEFRTYDGNGFCIRITNQTGDMISLRQEPNGRFSAIALLDGITFADQRESFVAFIKVNRKIASSDLLPALALFGFDPILPPDSAAVRHAVLTSLLSPEEAQAEGKRLLADLDSDDYETRERATQALSGRYDLYQVLINGASQNQANSPEVQIRLQKIVDQQPLVRRPMDTAGALGLAHDLNYIVSLFDDSHPQAWPQIAKQLETLTGQKFGPDPATWNSWAKNNQH